MRHPDRERLTLVALGEQPVLDDLSTHLDQCAQCRTEVTAMRDTVALARTYHPDVAVRGDLSGRRRFFDSSKAHGGVGWSQDAQ